MPRKIERLKREALAACRWRGHTMDKWETITRNRSAISSCSFCNATVGVHAKPAPNEIDIGGSAVALNCPAG